LLGLLSYPLAKSRLQGGLADRNPSNSAEIDPPP
jgi:hypothetical protein